MDAPLLPARGDSDKDTCSHPAVMVGPARLRDRRPARGRPHASRAATGARSSTPP
ncbi:hypothetical protein BHM03_00001578 [Ensete ventricosum]|nr:hypothetical protein BHM03_00001578 [Ensete ventricosum]